MTDYIGNYLDSRVTRKRVETRLREQEAEYEGALDREKAAFLILARQTGCSVCHAYTGLNCRFDNGEEYRMRVHEARAKLARERLVAVGIQDVETLV